MPQSVLDSVGGTNVLTLLVLIPAVLAVVTFLLVQLFSPRGADGDPEEDADDDERQELRAEARVLVERQNHRRIAAGQPPLDVEAEVDRRLRELGA